MLLYTKPTLTGFTHHFEKALFLKNVVDQISNFACGRLPLS
jgi:hypothetical protein